MLLLFSPDSYYPHSTAVSFCQLQIHTPLTMHFKKTAARAVQAIQILLCYVFADIYRCSQHYMKRQQKNALWLETNVIFQIKLDCITATFSHVFVRLGGWIFLNQSWLQLLLFRSVTKLSLTQPRRTRFLTLLINVNIIPLSTNATIICVACLVS